MRTSAVSSPQRYATRLSDGCRLPNIASESSELIAALSAVARVVMCSVLGGSEGMREWRDTAMGRKNAGSSPLIFSTYFVTQMSLTCFHVL